MCPVHWKTQHNGGKNSRQRLSHTTTLPHIVLEFWWQNENWNNLRSLFLLYQCTGIYIPVTEIAQVLLKISYILCESSCLSSATHQTRSPRHLNHLWFSHPLFIIMILVSGGQSRQGTGYRMCYYPSDQFVNEMSIVIRRH